MMINPDQQRADLVLLDDLVDEISRRLQIPAGDLAAARNSALNYLSRPRPAATSSRNPS